MIKRRREVCYKFEGILKKYDHLFHTPNFEGNSSFCLPFMVKDRSLRDDLQDHLESTGIETRPLCSGNLLRQPFLSEYEPYKEFPKVDYLHYQGFFIGNSHLVTDEDIEKLEVILDDYIRVL
jgi:CDP-6-deoxy-D-xylo-4-hexulose-3-dehydrase